MLASDLVQIHEYFGDSQVVFVSLTPDGEASAERFKELHDITWLMGWGAGDVIHRYLGTRYPTLAVIGRNGHVYWNDGSSRLQHSGPEAARTLFEHIQRLLTDR